MLKGLLSGLANQAQHIPEKARPVPRETAPLVNSQEIVSEPVGTLPAGYFYIPEALGQAVSAP